MSIATDIKEYGLYLGYCKVGIIPADNFDEYLDEIHSRGDYGFLTKAGLVNNTFQGSKPRDVMPSAKSIVVLVLDYKQKAIPQNLDDMIASIYLARCYLPPANSLNGARLELMIDYLKSLGCEVRSDVGIPARASAAKAGAVTIGKNTFAYVDGIGSFVVIYTLMIDKELEYDAPAIHNKCPANCTKCIDACPTQAITKPFHLSPQLCIAYNNWVAKEIPIELREKIGSRIHGCDSCQKACPRNQIKDNDRLLKDEFLEEISNDLTLVTLLNMDDDFYQRRIKPIMYNYISNLDLFRRNAAIAMGNSKDQEYVQNLEMALKEQSPMVRRYAAWALGQIGGDKAKRILQCSLASEQPEPVTTEILSALQNA